MLWTQHVLKRSTINTFQQATVKRTLRRDCSFVKDRSDAETPSVIRVHDMNYVWGHMAMVLLLCEGQSHVRPSPWGRWPEGSRNRVSQSLGEKKNVHYYRQLKTKKSRYYNIFNENFLPTSKLGNNKRGTVIKWKKSHLCFSTPKNIFQLLITPRW